MSGSFSDNENGPSTCKCVVLMNDGGVVFVIREFDVMIVWANGLPWFPVYKAFYVPCGSWNSASYLVGRKYRLSTSEFYLGAALAPPAAVQASLEDSLTHLTLRAFDSSTYPNIDRTNGPLDLIHVATISRGQNKVPCRFIMNKDPTAYALVYQSKARNIWQMLVCWIWKFLTCQ